MVVKRSRRLSPIRAPANSNRGAHDFPGRRRHLSFIRPGANSFISKPVTFNGLVEAIKDLGKYWFAVVDLPPGKG